MARRDFGICVERKGAWVGVSVQGAACVAVGGRGHNLQLHGKHAQRAALPHKRRRGLRRALKLSVLGLLPKAVVPLAGPRKTHAEALPILCRRGHALQHRTKPVLHCTAHAVVQHRREVPQRLSRAAACKNTRHHTQPPHPTLICSSQHTSSPTSMHGPDLSFFPCTSKCTHPLGSELNFLANTCSAWCHSDTRDSHACR